MILGLATILICGTAWCEDPTAIRKALDRQPQWNEKPFAPADGSTVQTNPPAFVWLPLPKRPAGYVLAISGSAEFGKDGTITFDNVPISVHIPTQTIEPGRWHWRVGVRGADGKIVWGRTRGFVLAADAQAWPFPQIDRLVTQIPRRHPRLFFAGEKADWARAQWPKLQPREYRSVLQAAESHLDKPIIAEPGFLSKTGVERGAEYAGIMRSTRPPMDAMETCALAWLVSGQQRFGDEAKRRLLHFFAWNPNGSTSLFHNDEPAMWVMQRGIRAYDWTYDLFTPDERARIEPAMKARAEQFLRRLTHMPFESNPYLSHLARDVGFLGETAMCFIHEWPEARGWLEYVLKIYRSVYPAWGAEDGGWQEGPSYWNAYMSFALHFATALKMATGEDITRKPFFRSTPYYKLYTNPPYARMSPFGDDQHSPPGFGAGQLLYQFSTLLHDPYLRWYPEAQGAGPGGGPMSVVLTDPSLKARPPVDLPQARVFPGAGLVAMHDDLADPGQGAYLVLRSSPLGSVSHGHADQNAFAIEAFGEALAIASGYYPWFGSHHHERWYCQTKAVNSVTVDGGQGQKGHSPQASGRIEQFVTRDRYDYVRADATAAYDGKLTRFVRHVLHVRPATFVIVDELEAPRPVVFEWLLHALEKMEIRSDKSEVLIRRGDARLRATFVAPVGLKFSQTDQFDPPPENGAPNQWHLTAAPGEKSTSAQFFVILSAYRESKGSAAAVQPPLVRPIHDRNAPGVAWTHDGVEQKVFFSLGGIRTEGVETDPQPVSTEPRLAVVLDGHRSELHGRWVSPERAVWQQPYVGKEGRFRVQLPPGMRLLLDAQPVHSGDSPSLKPGQTLWWYGRLPSEPAVLHAQGKSGR